MDTEESAISSLNAFRRFSEVVSAFNRAFLSVYTLSVRLLYDMMRFALGLNQWIRNLLVTRFEGYTPPTLATESLGIMEALMSSLEPLKLSITLKAPTTTVIPDVLQRIGTGAAKMIGPPLGQIGLPPSPPPPPVFQPPALEVAETVAGRVGELLETGRMIRRAPPTLMAAKGVSYAATVSEVYRSGVFEAVSATVESAMEEATRYSLQFAELPETGEEMVGPEVEGLFAALAGGPQPLIEMAKEFLGLPTEEAAEAPSVTLEIEAPLEIREGRRMAQRPIAPRLPEIAKPIKDITEGLSEAAPTIERQLSGLMEKGFEGVAAVGELAGYYSMVMSGASEAYETIRGMLEVGEAALEVLRGPSAEFTPHILEMQRALAEGLPMADLGTLVRGVSSFVTGLAYTGTGTYALEVPPGGFSATPQMLKLHEIAPLMNLLSASTRGARAPRVQRPLDVTVKVESLTDERDLRELERKIAKILRDAARRHGVPL